MNKTVLGTDRKPTPNTVEAPAKVIQPVEEPKVVMESEKGGGGVITQKQLITTLIVIVVIAVVVVVAVWLYKKYQKSPLIPSANAN